ncbi:hypothetical protein HK101_001372 [Irineochytrium annulatum]|nr:hypothetical protein HK101_001372 [Irineochytrium annulatum]
MEKKRKGLGRVTVGLNRDNIKEVLLNLLNEAVIRDNPEGENESDREPVDSEIEVEPVDSEREGEDGESEEEGSTRTLERFGVSDDVEEAGRYDDADEDDVKGVIVSEVDKLGTPRKTNIPATTSGLKRKAPAETKKAKRKREKREGNAAGGQYDYLTPTKP